MRLPGIPIFTYVKTPPQLPTYWPPDLFEVFTRHFYPKGIIGGMKGWKWPHSTNWITHGRFLLTKVTDQVLSSLFWEDHEQITDNDQKWYVSQFSQHSSAAGAYLAGILKKREFLPEILRLLPQSTSHWYGTGPFIALAMMNDSDTVARIESLREDENCREGANLALGLISKGGLVDHLGPRGARQIRKGIAYGQRLRAGIPFEDDRELRQGLSRLLSISTPPQYAMWGCLTYTPPRFYDDGKAEFRPRQEGKAGLNLAGLTYRPRRESLSALPIPQNEKLTNTWTFTLSVQDFLRNDGLAHYLAPVIASARQCQIPQDLLGGLEADWMYHLPHQIVTLVFERLLQLLPASDYLFESYAYALLMRGNQKDDYAQSLLAKAVHLQKEFRWAAYLRSTRFPVSPDYELQEKETFLKEKGSRVIFNPIPMP